MRNKEIKPHLKKILKKLSKKDKKAYEIILGKIGEVLICEGVEHYKNLRKPLQHLKSVHIKSSFVLTFKYIKSEDKIVFCDFDYHDNIYK